MLSCVRGFILAGSLHLNGGNCLSMSDILHIRFPNFELGFCSDSGGIHEDSWKILGFENFKVLYYNFGCLPYSMVKMEFPYISCYFRIAYCNQLLF